MKIKTNELIGTQLDWAVATCEGYSQLRENPHKFNNELIMNDPRGEAVWFHQLKFSSDWALAGPIIEREEIGISRRAPCFEGEEWEARGSITTKGAGYKWAKGPTPLVAAMRCYVASRLGDEI